MKPDRHIIHQITKGDMEAVRRCLALGANPTPALKHAVTQKKMGAIKLLLKVGANPNGLLQSLLTLNTHARNNIARILIQHGVDPNVPDLEDDNNTPLHTAAKLDRLDQLKMLVEEGADIHTRNTRNQTALSIAIGNKNIGIVLFLLGNGNTFAEALPGIQKTSEFREVADSLPPESDGAAIFCIARFKQRIQLLQHYNPSSLTAAKDAAEFIIEKNQKDIAAAAVAKAAAPPNEAPAVAVWLTKQHMRIHRNQ